MARTQVAKGRRTLILLLSRGFPRSSPRGAAPSGFSLKAPPLSPLICKFLIDLRFLLACYNAHWRVSMYYVFSLFFTLIPSVLLILLDVRVIILFK